MSKIWSYAFWGERRQEKAPAGIPGDDGAHGGPGRLHHRDGSCLRSHSWGWPRGRRKRITKPDEYIRVVLSAKQNRLAEMPRPSAQVVARAEEAR